VLTWFLLVAAALAAGIVNAVAGGGSLISFPALLLTGMGSVRANATNTLAVWPGSVSSAWAYKDHILDERHRAAVLAVPSLLGGLAGSVLLLNTPEKAFGAIVPWLIFFACALLAFQAKVAKLLKGATAGPGDRVPPGLWIMQFLISVYGGYFGAGIGILMLAALGAMGLTNIHRMNGLKNWGATCINAVAALTFVVSGIVDWPVAIAMAAGGLAGGYGGARLALRVGQTWVRRAVVAIGFGAFVWLVIRARMT
jgi:uncharacterized protein